MAKFVGEVGYTFTGDGYVSIRVQNILNLESLTSGLLKMELWNLDKPRGQGGQYHVVASYQFSDPLLIGQAYSNVERKVKMLQNVTRPRMALVLLSRQDGVFEFEDARDFDKKVNFIDANPKTNNNANEELIAKLALLKLMSDLGALK